MAKQELPIQHRSISSLDQCAVFLQQADPSIQQVFSQISHPIIPRVLSSASAHSTFHDYGSRILIQKHLNEL